ncbi:LLM class flavin-dependent oxidoreductase [Pseudomonas typographi]|uniref:LLM class flavin-dependent oxidoreductase n=1 Tax=Pseudomonas typographi TaxID=2715964 RepID=UPI00168437D8|nr:LLM class flavin-dependent oxidoreductase [Pseudomonas typographi]MBD1551046.1 LLM class flavin-dependent oxidoreductase [Pseudomonas typographi]
MSSDNEIKLGFFSQDVGHHVAAWRHPDVPADGGMSLDFHRNIARTAERGKLDMVFFGDQMAPMYPEDEQLGGTSRMLRLEPTALISALAAVTTHIGFVATVSMAYFEPFHIARKFATLDRMNGGRTGWNMVTSFESREALNFNVGVVSPPELRYRRAHEFAEVVKKLWDSWDDNALLRDKESARFFDPARLRVPEHKGEFYSSRGPLNVERSVQGQPVLVQAGSSPEGIEFAAHHAEVVFTAQSDLGDAQAFYGKVKGIAASQGRDPDHIKIMPGVMCFIGQTREQAHEKYARLQALITPQVGWMVVKQHLGVDISALPLDEPLPNFTASTGQLSRQQLLIDAARRDHLTVRQFYQRYVGSRGHHVVIGTPSDIADIFESWVDECAADGFNLMVPWSPGGLDDVVDLLVPELQRRQRFRREYTGTTLREHLGLPVPKSQYAP